MNFKPMLAATVEAEGFTDLRYPLLASPKLDGLRCIVWEGVAYSRNAKPFRNRFLQEWAKNHHNLDGEIIVGDPTDPHCLDNSKAVTAFEGQPDFNLFLFDAPTRFDSQDRFDASLRHVQDNHEGEPRIVCVPHYKIREPAELQKQIRDFLNMGYEGACIRDPDGPYKHGRSTLREGWLLKYKEFTDGEAVVLRIEEGRTNMNELKRDELGRAKRQGLSENMVPNGMVGTLICMDETWGEIRVSPGKMSHADRFGFFRSPENLVGRRIHWRSFGYGTKDAPRFARYYGLREDIA